MFQGLHYTLSGFQGTLPSIDAFLASIISSCAISFAHHNVATYKQKTAVLYERKRRRDSSKLKICAATSRLICILNTRLPVNCHTLHLPRKAVALWEWVGPVIPCDSTFTISSSEIGSDIGQSRSMFREPELL